MEPEKPKRRAGGKPFQKGDPRCGRPPGLVNKTTKEVREIATRLVEDGEYRSSLRMRLVSGTLAPAVESMLWHYAYGKPKETHVIEGGPRALTFYELPRNGRESE